MKKSIVLIILGMTTSFYSCVKKQNEEKQEKVTIKINKETQKNKNPEKDNIDLITKGEKLFKDKTCFTCHLIDKKSIGPSVKTINTVYTSKSANLIAYFKREAKPIVITEKAQIDIMNANLKGFVKDLKDEELLAIKAYIHSIK